MATTVLPTAASAVQATGILTLKDFQQKNGIRPWMARVRIFRMWHETDFMKTNDVTSLDLLLLDDTGDLLHAIVQKKFIWKFEPLIEEGMLLCLNNLTFAPEKKMFCPAQNDYRAYFNWNTDITPLGTSNSSIPRHKFNFTELEDLAAANANTYLTGKASLSSTNATKIYFDIDIPEVLHIRERYLLMLEVEDSSGTAFFVAMDSEVQKIVQLPALDVVAKGEVKGFETVKAAFESLIGVFQDYHILITPYNMKFLEIPSFTVAKFPSPPPAPTPIISAEATEISNPEDEPVADHEPPRKKPCLQKIPDSESASTVAEN